MYVRDDLEKTIISRQVHFDRPYHCPSMKIKTITAMLLTSLSRAEEWAVAVVFADVVVAAVDVVVVLV